MIMRKVLFLILLMAMLIVSCFAQQNPIALTISEKAQIVESVLIDENLPNRSLIVGEKRMETFSSRPKKLLLCLCRKLKESILFCLIGSKSNRWTLNMAFICLELSFKTENTLKFHSEDILRRMTNWTVRAKPINAKN